MEEAKKFQENFDEAMDDDFNTADAIAAIFDLVKFANTNAGEGSSKAFVDALKKMIQRSVRYSWTDYREEGRTAGCRY